MMGDGLLDFWKYASRSSVTAAESNTLLVIGSCDEKYC
jgi:hypothetical protein